MKVLLSTPLYNNQLDSRMVSTVLEMIAFAQENNISINWDRPSSCFLPHNRNISADHALKDGFDWIMFIDADTVLPPESKSPFALITETAYKKDAKVIGAPIRLKNNDIKKVWNFCHKKSEGYVNYVGELPSDTMEVDVIGTGLLAIHTILFKEIKTPWFEQVMTYHTTPGFFPEDYLFCEKAKQRGFKIYMEPTVTPIHYGSYGYR